MTGGYSLFGKDLLYTVPFGLFYGITIGIYYSTETLTFFFGSGQIIGCIYLLKKSTNVDGGIPINFL